MHVHTLRLARPCVSATRTRTGRTVGYCAMMEEEATGVVDADSHFPQLSLSDSDSDDNNNSNGVDHGVLRGKRDKMRSTEDGGSASAINGVSFESPASGAGRSKNDKKTRRKDAKARARQNARAHDAHNAADAVRLPTVPLSTALIGGDGEANAQQLASPAVVEDTYVHGVYNAIADHFSHTRHSPWPIVRDFIECLSIGSAIADIGCGNGKYLGIASDRVYAHGSDRSDALVGLCTSRGYDALVCDNLSLPYRDASFDAAISIAVIHHLATRERRVRAVREMARIVRCGGRILIFVWAYEQNKHGMNDAQDVLIPWHLQKGYATAFSEAPSVQPPQSTTPSTTPLLPAIPPSQSAPIHDNSVVAAPSDDALKATVGVSIPPQSTDIREPDSTGHTIVTPAAAGFSAHSAHPIGGSKAAVYQRYYHLFRQGELESMVDDAACGLQIVSSGFDHENWYCIAEKVSR